MADGKDLYWWHPLVSGDPETVHQAGVSVRGKVGASEVDVPDKDLEDHHRELAAEVAEGGEGEKVGAGKEWAQKSIWRNTIFCAEASPCGIIALGVRQRSQHTYKLIAGGRSFARYIQLGTS